MEKTFYLLATISQQLFGNQTELLPSVNELFELEMAHLEYTILPQQQLINRSAFFKKIAGEPTKHFLFCSHQAKVVSENRSAKTRSYFEDGQFATGYATHSLFPYRGKFHPQLIKGILNILDIQAGETILDPMCGSGTANIEAALMGIHSFAVDVSPFCQFMTQTKFDALRIQKPLLEQIYGKAHALFDFFCVENVSEQLNKIADPEKLKVYHVALLAFLDAMGYAKRVTTSTHAQLFEKVLIRYIETIKNFSDQPEIFPNGLGHVTVFPHSHALHLEIEDNSVDGVITSPPYSFAIDYAKNDAAQLEYLGHNVSVLRTQMIGLVGKNKQERLQNYFHDMVLVCSEIYRVLKPKKYLVMIIGSNTNQTGGIRLEQTIIEACEKLGMVLVKTILKPIKGMRNIMKDEYILFFQKI